MKDRYLMFRGFVKTLLAFCRKAESLQEVIDHLESLLKK